MVMHMGLDTQQDFCICAATGKTAELERSLSRDHIFKQFESIGYWN
jgi:hypothetical protein